jgi:hypothetical protein
MGDPIKIIVTAETAQAAAALQQFVTGAGSGLRSLAPAAAKAGNELTQLRQSAMGLREGFRVMEMGVYMLGGQRFPMLAQSVMGVRSAMMLVRTAAMLTGASLAVVGTTVAALALALLPTAIMGWKAHEAAEEEARSEAELHNQTLKLQSELLARINKLKQEGFLTDGDIVSMQTAGDIAQVKHPEDEAAGLKAQQKYLLDRNLTGPATEAVIALAALQKKVHEENMASFDAERQKAKDVLDQRLLDIKAWAEAAGPSLDINQVNAVKQEAYASYDKTAGKIAEDEQQKKAKDAIELNPSSSHWGGKQLFQEAGMCKSLVLLLSAGSKASVVEKSML